MMGSQSDSQTHQQHQQQQPPPPPPPAMSKYDRVELIPWDPTSEVHTERLREQRLACTWDYDVIDEWKARVLEGKKFFYWIKLRDNLERGDEILATHIEGSPKEREPIIDTAAILANKPRTPTNKSFVPIGHIALDLFPERNVKLSLPEETVWIKSFYISWALQAGGYGRAAMFQIERLAALAPLNAKTMALDTATKEFLQRPEVAVVFSKARTVRPKSASQAPATEDWYRRQGYEVVARQAKMYDWVNPATGERTDVPCIYLKKDLV